MERPPSDEQDCGARGLDQEPAARRREGIFAVIGAVIGLVGLSTAKVSGPAASQGSDLVCNGIDQFVLSKLEEKGLRHFPEASPRILVRRLFHNLIGEPPSPAEVESFLEDKSPDAYEKLVDRLLADPRYGERWGRHWLDLARYADSQGYEGDPELSHAWRYRDYVIDSFNKDKPYDLFVKEQIAGGDELAVQASAEDDDGAPRRARGGSPEAQIALGFLRLGPRTPNVSLVESRQMMLDEMTATVSSVFLGLTVKRAQCHDHKYDPIPQKDFYRLEAFFAPIELVDSRVEFTDPAMKARMDARHAEFDALLKSAEQNFKEYQNKMMAKLTEVLRAQPDSKAEANPRRADQAPDPGRRREPHGQPGYDFHRSGEGTLFRLVEPGRHQKRRHRFTKAPGCPV